MKTYNFDEAMKLHRGTTYMYEGNDEGGKFWVSKEDLCVGCEVDVACDFDSWGSFTYKSYDYVCDNLLAKLDKYSWKFAGNPSKTTKITQIREKSYQLTTMVYFGKSEVAKSIVWYIPKGALRKKAY